MYVLDDLVVVFLWFLVYRGWMTRRPCELESRSHLT